jgi:hypothetical protein
VRDSRARLAPPRMRRPPRIAAHGANRSAAAAARIATLQSVAGPVVVSDVRVVVGMRAACQGPAGASRYFYRTHGEKTRPEYAGLNPRMAFSQGVRGVCLAPSSGNMCGTSGSGI